MSDIENVNAKENSVKMDEYRGKTRVSTGCQSLYATAPANYANLSWNGLSKEING